MNDFYEILYVGIDIGKARHVAGFVSDALFSRYRRFERCPVLSFEQSRAGFERLLAAIETYGPLDRCAVVMEHTGHYHRLVEQYLLEHNIALYEIHAQKREHRDKTDKRDALSLANHLYNQLAKGVQFSETIKLARRVLPPTETATYLRSLVKHREVLSREITQRKNNLIAICDEVFPELTHIIKDTNGATALNIREKFPTAASIAAASLDELRTCRINYRPTDRQFEELHDLATQSIGTRDPGRIKSLTMQQKHLIKELRLLQQHTEEIDGEITTALKNSREGQILDSLPIFGPVQSATLIASIGNIHNFSRQSELKSYCGWSPTTVQTGTSVDQVKLTKGGNPVLKRMIYLVTMSAIKLDTEWRDLYNRLVPIKCNYDTRTKAFRGRMKVVGRVAGQIISLVYTLLKKDADILASLAEGEEPPPPMLYDRALHHAHRHGSYRRADSVPLGSPIALTEFLHNE